MKVLLFIFVVAVAYSVYEYQRIRPLYKTGLEIADIAQAYQQTPDRPAKRVLVLGDSTGVGTGASSAEFSVSGRLGAEHPDWLIENRAVNGAKLHEVRGQIEEGDEFDLVMLHAGGNDVLRMATRSKLRKDARALLEDVSKVSEDVIWVSSGNIGASPFIPVAFRPLLSSRSKTARSVFMNLADEFGSRTTYVDLFKKRSEDTFYNNPDKYYAEDLLHPSDDGYRIWFEQITSVIQ